MGRLHEWADVGVAVCVEPFPCPLVVSAHVLGKDAATPGTLPL